MDLNATDDDFSRKIETRNFTLETWQEDAVEVWSADKPCGAGVGTFEIFTGGGKTLIALSCIERANTVADELRVAVVVPTQALAHQWREAFVAFTNLEAKDVGILGAGGRDTLANKRVLIAVLNSAARHLPEMVAELVCPTMLVVDECHRAGAPTFSRVLSVPCKFKLGLSATPDRDEYDTDGEPLVFDEQIVGKALGPVVYQFGLREARATGWLPEFSVHHHSVELLAEERAEYDRISRQVDELGDRLRGLGGDPTRARVVAKQPGDIGAAASAYVALTSKRKDLLYRAKERGRVTAAILVRVLTLRPEARALTFHERIDEAVDLEQILDSSLNATVGIEHSRMSNKARRSILESFRDGTIQVLVSVKSLIEGIDVPSADIGVSVASSSSVRQRIQALGRVLRRSFDSPDKVAEMHVIYVRDSVDEFIYAKEDWSDLTGNASNVYWEWSLSPDETRTRLNGPPRVPYPTEDQEFERFGRIAPAQPKHYRGIQPEREYSVDTTGTVRTATGALVENPQGVSEMVAGVRGRQGGKFFLTNRHSLVIVRETGPAGRLLVTGQVTEPFSIRRPELDNEETSTTSLLPGSPYSGGLDFTNGEYRLAKKRGGVIERRLPGGAIEFALTRGDGPQIANAVSVLTAWQSLALPGCKFGVNERWQAWYVAASEPRYFVTVPGGFAWPSERREVSK